MLKMIFRIDFLASTRASPISSHPIVAPYCTQQFELMYSRALEPRQRRRTLLSHPIVAPYCTQYRRTLLSHPIVPNIVAPYCRTLLYPISSHPIVAPHSTKQFELIYSWALEPRQYWVQWGATTGCDMPTHTHSHARTHTCDKKKMWFFFNIWIASWSKSNRASPTHTHTLFHTHARSLPHTHTHSFPHTHAHLLLHKCYLFPRISSALWSRRTRAPPTCCRCWNGWWLSWRRRCKVCRVWQ